MYNAFVLFFSASPTIDEFDEVQRAKEERREIVAKYDKVNKIVCWGGGGRSGRQTKAYEDEVSPEFRKVIELT